MTRHVSTAMGQIEPSEVRGPTGYLWPEFDVGGFCRERLKPP